MKVREKDRHGENKGWRREEGEGGWKVKEIKIRKSARKKGL